jgi:LEA14-like dessication related protein
MNKGRIIIWSLVAILISVIVYVAYQLIKITKSPLTYKGFKINSISLSRINLTAYFKLVNSGDAQVTISGQDYNVYLNGKFVSHMKYSNPIIIAPGENILPLEVNIGLSDVLKAGWANLTELLTDKSKVNITLNGKFSVKISVIEFKNVKIDETFNLADIGKPAESSYMVTGCPPGLLPDPTTGICGKNNVWWNA